MVSRKEEEIQLNETRKIKRSTKDLGKKSTKSQLKDETKNSLLQTWVKFKQEKSTTNVVLEENVTESENAGDEGRETWDKSMDFLLSIVGFAVDLANVWRFPYLCYKNGGGAFLIPYFTMLVCAALPLFLMELLLGQCHQRGCIAIWRLVPLFKGVGICQCLISFYVSFYYNVIIAWSVYYLFSSFTSQLPWTTCDNSWNTPYCTPISHHPNHSHYNHSHHNHPYYNHSLYNQSFYNLSHHNSSFYNHFSHNNSSYNISSNSSDLNSTTYTPTEEYFERRVLGLHLSGGLEDLGAPRGYLVICLVAVFTIIYFSLWKGVKSSGKVVWVTATLPYLVLSILLIRGLTLPGATDGILYYITPNLNSINNSKVWLDAAVQIYYSVGAGFGVHMAYASYNKKNHNCYRDCLITGAVNSFTSLFSGFVIFCFLGNMAHSQGRHISTVAAEGPGLVFIVYPEAVASLPGSVFWSIIFFIMLIMLGIDSALGGLEALLTGIGDELGGRIKNIRFSREILTFMVVLGTFLFALPNVTNGGIYLVTLWDTFASGAAILTGVLFEVVAIGWFYGLDQFCKDIKQALNFEPSLYWKICWKFVSPITILVVLTCSFVSTSNSLQYISHTLPSYTFPPWSLWLGWTITLSSVIFIPFTAIYQLVTTSGTFSQRLALNISPHWEHEDIRNNGQVKRFKLKHWLW